MSYGECDTLMPRFPAELSLTDFMRPLLMAIKHDTNFLTVTWRYADVSNDSEPHTTQMVRFSNDAQSDKSNEL